MNSIYRMSDLEQYGIYPLTGEACSLCMRVLCDYDRRGQKIIASWLGMPEFSGNEAYNRGTAGKEHVGSILLDPGVVHSVGVFALFSAGHDRVIHVTQNVAVEDAYNRLADETKRLIEAIEGDYDEVGKSASVLAAKVAVKARIANFKWQLRYVVAPNQVIGVEKDEDIEDMLKLIGLSGYSCRVFVNRNAGSGGRNQHAMSGRIY